MLWRGHQNILKLFIMDEKPKEKGARLSHIDSFPTKELRRYARVKTLENERLQFKLKDMKKKYLTSLRKIERLQGEKEELEAKLAENLKLETEPTLQPLDARQPGLDMPSPAVKAIENSTLQQTPVSQTQLSIAMPSSLKLVDWTNNGSQESIEAIPVNGSVTGEKWKSPKWKSIKKKPRPVDPPHLEPLDVPPPEHVGARLEEVSFKYLEVIRKNDERAKLPAGYCTECARFYKAYAEHGDLAKANELVKRLCGHSIHEQTSRHRRRYETPSTPPEYWDIIPIEPHS